MRVRVLVSTTYQPIRCSKHYIDHCSLCLGKVEQRKHHVYGAKHEWKKGQMWLEELRQQSEAWKASHWIGDYRGIENLNAENILQRKEPFPYHDDATHKLLLDPARPLGESIVPANWAKADTFVSRASLTPGIRG